jgi:hypothetical protein
MDEPRRRVASLAALGGAIGALAVDALYLNLIAGQGAMMPGGRVPFIALWIAIAAVLAGIGAFTDLPARRAWLLGWSAAAFVTLSVPAAFSIGIPLLLCGLAVALGALRAAELLHLPRWVAFLAPLLLLAVAAGALAVGFVLTDP